MSTVKHTPFPWNYAASELSPGRYSIYHNGPIAYCGDTTAAEGDGEANARLIAAAPFLLMALEEMLAELDNRKPPAGYTTDNFFGYPDTGGMVLARQAIAQATVNKATGED